MLGHRRVHVLSAAGTPPLVWFTVAVGPRAAAARRRRMGRRLLRVPARARARGPAVLVVQPRSTPARSGRPTTGSTPTRGGNGELYVNVNGIPHQALHPVDAPQGAVLRPALPLVPGQDVPDVLIVGAGSGHGRRDRAGARRGPRRCRRDRSGHPEARRATSTPTSPTRTRASRRYENDGRAFLRGTDKKYDLVDLRPARLADPRQLDGEHPARVIPVHRPGLPVRPRPPRARTASSCVYNYYRDNWLISKIASMLEASFEQPADRPRCTTPHKAIFADGPAVAALPTAASRPATASMPCPDPAGPGPKAATDDWPFLYLRTPFIAPYYFAALASAAVRACSACSARRARAGRRSAGSARTSSCSAPRSCCSRRASLVSF